MSKSFDNSDFKHHIDQVADLVREFKLTEAELEVDGFKISLKKSAPKVAQSVVLSHGEIAHTESAPAEHYEEQHYSETRFLLEQPHNTHE